MAYWIHENGETIGPLRAIEVLERAQPETLVSNGQEWVRLAKHPDFLTVTEAGSSWKANSHSESEGTEATGLTRQTEEGCPSEPVDQDRKYRVITPGSSNPKGPFSYEKVARDVPDRFLVSSGDEWIPKGRHPDFSKHANPGNVMSILANRWMGIRATIEASGFGISFLVIAALSISAIIGTAAYINHGVETDEIGPLGDAIRKADRDWHAGRQEEAIAAYRELLEGYGIDRANDYRRILKRVIQYDLESDTKENSLKYISLCNSRKLVLHFSDQKIQNLYQNYLQRIRAEILQRQIEEARTPAFVSISCKYSSDPWRMTVDVANAVWKAAYENQNKSTLQVSILVNGVDRYGQVNTKRCSVIVDAFEIRLYENAHYFISDSSSQDLMKIWIALKNI